MISLQMKGVIKIMKNKVISKVMVFLLLAVLVYSKPVMAQAADPNLVPDLADGQKSSLTITLSYQNDDKQTVNLSGQELTIYQVAALTVKNGSASYTLTEDFNTTGIKLEGMTIEQSKEYAKELEQVIAANQSKGTSKSTDSNGMASFEDLNAGMYLVTFKQKADQGTMTYTMDSFLISAPSVEVRDNENVWNYEVKTEPKFGVNISKVPVPTQSPVITPAPTVQPSGNPNVTPVPTSTPVTPPKTGDDTNVVFWWCMFAGALLGLVVLIVPFTKKQKKNK